MSRSDTTAVHANWEFHGCESYSSDDSSCSWRASREYNEASSAHRSDGYTEKNIVTPPSTRHRRADRREEMPPRREEKMPLHEDAEWIIAHRLARAIRAAMDLNGSVSLGSPDKQQHAKADRYFGKARVNHRGDMDHGDVAVVIEEGLDQIRAEMARGSEKESRRLKQRVHAVKTKQNREGQGRATSKTGCLSACPVCGCRARPAVNTAKSVPCETHEHAKKWSDSAAQAQARHCVRKQSLVGGGIAGKGSTDAELLIAEKLLHAVRGTVGEGGHCSAIAPCFSERREGQPKIAPVDADGARLAEAATETTNASKARSTTDGIKTLLPSSTINGTLSSLGQDTPADSKTWRGRGSSVKADTRHHFLTRSNTISCQPRPHNTPHHQHFDVVKRSTRPGPPLPPEALVDVKVETPSAPDYDGPSVINGDSSFVDAGTVAVLNQANKNRWALNLSTPMVVPEIMQHGQRLLASSVPERTTTDQKPAGGDTCGSTGPQV